MGINYECPANKNAEARHGMVWSKEINKTFCALRARHYPGRKAIASPGFLRNNPVWLATIAIREHDDGYVCPYCGGREDAGETLNTVEFADYVDGQEFCSELLDNCGSLVDARFSNGKVIATGDTAILDDWCNDSRVKHFYKATL